jgi:hypothetical protein
MPADAFLWPNRSEPEIFAGLKNIKNEQKSC